MLVGCAMVNSLAFSGSNYLFSMLRSSDLKEERKRHDQAVEQLQAAQAKWSRKRIERLDWISKQKVPSGVGVRYLYQPGEQEGGRRRATDPVWSFEIYRLGRSVTKPDEPVLYYLQGDDAPQRGFVREELLAVPSDTQLPPDGVLRVEQLFNPPRDIPRGPHPCVHMPAYPPHFL